MTLRTVTKFIVISVALFLIAYDIIPFKAPEHGDTISEVIRDWALKCMSIPFVFGVLAGHFFIPRDKGEVYPKVLVGLLIGIISLDIAVYVCNITPLVWVRSHPILPFIAGVPMGPLFWRQLRSEG